jgi:hypothetical protein
MPLDFGNVLNLLETRVSRLENSAMVPTSGLADVGADEVTNAVTVYDQLDWTVAPTGWEPFSTVGPIIDDPGTDGYPGLLLSTPYGRPEAHKVGSMCVLTGMVRRKAGATPNPLVSGTRLNLPMFGLPPNWRPVTSIILPCLTGNTDPLTGTAVGTAWIEVRADLDPLQASGRVYLVSTTVNLAPTTGWIALQGVFPIQVIDASATGIVEDSWNDVHFQTTWDSIDENVTWNNYTSIE